MRGIILLIAFIVFGIVIFLLNKFARPKKAVKQEEAPAAPKVENTKTETATTEEECGNYKDHNLEEAKLYAQKWVDGISQKGWSAF